MTMQKFVIFGFVSIMVFTSCSKIVSKSSNGTTQTVNTSSGSGANGSGADGDSNFSQAAAGEGVCSFLSPLPADFTQSKAHTFNFNCLAPSGATIKDVQCRLDQVAWVACQSDTSHPLSSLSEGPHSFEIRYTSEGVNPSDPDIVSISRSIFWTVDSLAPIVNITQAQVQTLYPAFAFQGSDALGSGISKYECKLYQNGQSATWEQCVSFKQYLTPIESAKTYFFHVRAIDRAGNISPDAVYQWISGSPIGPTCRLVTAMPSSGYLNATSVKIDFSCTSTNPISETLCSVNGGSFAACTSSTFHQLSGLADGSVVTFLVKAKDNANVTGLPSVPWTAIVDVTPPVSKIHQIQSINPNALTFFSATDASPGMVQSLECSVVGLHGFISCASPKLYTGLTLNQTYEFQLRAKDFGGNVSPVVTKTFTSNTSLFRPTCTLTPNPQSLWSNQTSRSFSLQCDQTVSTLCSVNGGTYNACSFPLNVPTSSSASYQLSVKCVDGSSAEYPCGVSQWWVDLLAPTVQITNLEFVNSKTQITFQGADLGGSGILNFECKLDGVFDWKLCNSPHSMTEGNTVGTTYTFRARARDGAGNLSSEAVKTWTKAAAITIVASIGAEKCSNVCSAKGLVYANRCYSGEVRREEGGVVYVHGTFGSGNFSKIGVEKHKNYKYYCYHYGQTMDYDLTDITMGCECKAL